MRLARLRRTPGGTQVHGNRRRTLSPPDVHSAHLADTPAGPVTVWTSTTGLRRLEFGPLPRGAHVDAPDAWPPLLTSTVAQLQEYFGGRRQAFDIPFDLDAATDFQRQVYDRLLSVGYGQVVTYGDLARITGRPELARAVGQAVGANPIPILIPCHRVVAADGKLGGFSGGLPVKVALLRLEGVEVEGDRPSSRVHPEVLRLDL